jgi:hypothetical protein
MIPNRPFETTVLIRASPNRGDTRRRRYNKTVKRINNGEAGFFDREKTSGKRRDKPPRRDWLPEGISWDRPLKRILSIGSVDRLTDLLDLDSQSSGHKKNQFVPNHSNGNMLKALERKKKLG